MEAATATEGPLNIIAIPKELYIFEPTVTHRFRNLKQEELLLLPKPNRSFSGTGMAQPIDSALKGQDTVLKIRKFSDSPNDVHVALFGQDLCVTDLVKFFCFGTSMLEDPKKATTISISYDGTNMMSMHVRDVSLLYQMKTIPDLHIAYHKMNRMDIFQRSLEIPFTLRSNDHEPIKMPRNEDNTDYDFLKATSGKERELFV